MHSMPCVTPSPNGEIFFSCPPSPLSTANLSAQASSSPARAWTTASASTWSATALKRCGRRYSIVVLQSEQFDRKLVQVFKGHMVAGYACGLDFSPEMSYLCRQVKQIYRYTDCFLMRSFNITTTSFATFQWGWWWQGLYMGLEDYQTSIEVEGTRRRVYSGKN